MKMYQRGIVAISFIYFIMLYSVSAFADGKDELIEKLIKRVDGLESKVEALNKKLSIYEKSPAETIPDEVIQKKVDDLLAKRESIEGGLVKALKDISLSGFVDTSYTYNFRGPDSRTNTARVFDTEANNFNLQAAELVFEKLPPDSGGAGFRTDLYFGQDAEVITPAGSTRDQFDLEQAYISLKPPLNFNLPFGNWQWIKIGKFVTMHGAEVIEAKDNWNFTRSLLFGYAIPFTHTGIRAGYQIFDGLSGYLGINNGWDNVKDNNKTKSVEGALAWAASDKLSFNLAGMYGPEQASNDHSQRGLIDFLTTYKPFDKWTLMLNADYGHEEDVVAAGKDGAWSGVAGYLRYDTNSWMSLISRTEFMSDRQGLRIVSGTNQDVWEQTLTLELRPYKDLITRLEYRHDESSSDIFINNQKAVGRQDTIGLEAIYSF
ncbi:MAG: porin [Candidatus Omnitrophota bacterium]